MVNPSLKYFHVGIRTFYTTININSRLHQVLLELFFKNLLKGVSSHSLQHTDMLHIFTKIWPH